ncbi:MAG: hypothetical protein HQ477_00190 [Chloroflexi bacterium]|nr:hypothetical protein [Chloroflexota bacterium]
MASDFSSVLLSERDESGKRQWLLHAFFAGCLLLVFVVTSACSSESNELVPPDVGGDLSDLWTVETATPVVDDAAAPSSTAVPVISSRPLHREPTESFTVHQLDIEPLEGTVFEKLLSRMPDNEITRHYTRLGDVSGILDAMGLESFAPGAGKEELEGYFEYLKGSSNAFSIWNVIGAWPAEQRDYLTRIDTFPDLAFDWASVEAFAYSSNVFLVNSSTDISGPPVAYDVAFGHFDPGKTKTALASCDCDQPSVRVHEGIEYFRWGEGDGIGQIKDRFKRPFYDHLGRGPHLLVRNGEAYYTMHAGVIDAQIEVIRGMQPSLADDDEYIEAVQIMASLGIVSEISFKADGFSTEAVAISHTRVPEAITLDVEANPLMLPFEFAAFGAGFDGVREFTGVVLAHDDAASTEQNVNLALERLYKGVAIRQAPGRFTPWTELVDRVDIATQGSFLVALIYFTQTYGSGYLLMPNTLLVYE